MIICGLKLTHDGAIALIDNGKLIFSYEMEKLNNNGRFSALSTYYSKQLVSDILGENGYSIEDVDQFVIDGWGDHDSENNSNHDYPPFKTMLPQSENERFEIELAGYGLLVKDENIVERKFFNYPDYNFEYSSYMHTAGHVLSGYCTSPFAKKGEDAYVLAWDGGMFPQVFYVNAKTRKIDNLGTLFHLLGISYAAFATNYKPYNKYSVDDGSVAGKVMAYIALGKCNDEALAEFKRLFEVQEQEIASKPDLKSKDLIAYTSKLLSEFVIYGELNDVDGVDMMATFHVFLQDVLLERLTKLVEKQTDRMPNFCFVGGCALNIKWNSNIRNSGLFNDVWVPPFPNDSGSAIGAACCEMFVTEGRLAFDWDVYSGPFAKEGEFDQENWGKAECSLTDLAQLLHEYDEPVVFLNGRAELGPRALGNRSILAAPVNPSMKEELNRAKNREAYRPVAPICKEDKAMEIFTPGSSDPYMLFDHKVRPEWIDKIPAICHLDGTARLQTVSREGNAQIYDLISAYEALSGVPLLCNTSANFNGKGFFPDVKSVMEWGEVNMVWQDGHIYAKRNSTVFSTSNLFKKDLNLA